MLVASFGVHVSAGAKPMVKSEGFYVSERWIGDLHTATLHRGDCPRCNNAKGPIELFGPPDKWHGPYKTQKDAAVKSSELPNVNVRSICECAEANTKH